ncbi:MAG: hypothetical protein DRP62_00715 [Planctomycetota bacterium]|nr:MAG: hypothetical protein DRP62_00715 [Planctomycetota bacterium]
MPIVKGKNHAFQEIISKGTLAVIGVFERVFCKLSTNKATFCQRTEKFQEVRTYHYSTKVREYMVLKLNFVAKCNLFAVRELG